MKGKVYAALTMLAAMTSGTVFAQEVPLPQVERQISSTRISSAECNEPPVPELREPVSTPVLIAEQIQEPAQQQRPTVVSEAEQVALQPTPSEDQLSAAQAMALLQRTVRTGPYEDFVRALAVARQKVAAMPAGNERRAFTEALDAYSETATIWEHAMTHPMGAFFNDELLPGAFTRLAKKYPSYAAYIAQQSVTDSAGNTLYPTSETRTFLADEADRRLRGIRLPSPPPGVIAELPTRPSPEVAPVRPTPRPQQPVTRPRPTTTRPKPTTTPRPTTAQPRPAKPTPRPAPAVKPPVEKPAVTTRPTPTVKPPVEKPAVTTKPVTVPSSTAAPSTGEPIETTTVAPVVSTAVEAAPTTAAPAPRPEQLPAEGRRALPSQTMLLLVAFGVIALIAIVLMVRALRPREAPTTIIAQSPEPPHEPAPGDADWIDPETRHWIEDVNKTDKPPN